MVRRETVDLQAARERSDEVAVAGGRRRGCALGNGGEALAVDGRHGMECERNGRDSAVLTPRAARGNNHPDLERDSALQNRRLQPMRPAAAATHPGVTT
jgi:hypothetical protein